MEQFFKKQHARWHQRARHSVGHSLRVRLVLVFVVLAIAVSATFIFGMQKALGVGWKNAAQPLVSDYMERIVVDIGSPPSIERARAVTERLPITLRITGPVVNWESKTREEWQDAEHRRWHDQQNEAGSYGTRFWERKTADGHVITFGLNLSMLENQPRRMGWYTLAALLLLTTLAYLYVRRMLRPLDDIRLGAQRFGGGDFGLNIPIRRRDELGDLAQDVNQMASSIHQMLEAKRGLLLAISHELRSPLTRARLNTELLPEEGETAARREALLRDLNVMRDLVTDLLESERLGQGHAALHKELTDVGGLVQDVVQSLTAIYPAAAHVRVQAAQPMPLLALDRTRMRLLVRNLLDNALRHSSGSAHPPEVKVQLAEDAAMSILTLTVRDYGAGVDALALPHLAHAFYRPDGDRSRASGGVGLGLYLCKLVAQVHGGSLAFRNEQPGFMVTATLRCDSLA